MVSVFGPVPALLGGPFLEGLEPGAVITDLELERRTRHAATLAVSLAAMLLAAALSARMSPARAAGLALVTGLSFGGVATLGQGLWQQTAFVVPLMAAAATVAWARWRGGMLLLLTPALLSVAALTRPNAALLVVAVGVTWLLALKEHAGRRTLLAVALPLAVLVALPQLAWNASTTGDPLALHAYVEAHSDGGVVFDLAPRAFLTGIAGLLASPARGLLFFAPALLVELWVGLRAGDRSARVVGAGILLHVALVAAYRQWWGGWAFGPRMMADALWLAPLLVAGLPLPRGARIALAATGVVTVAVGLLGAFRYDPTWDLRRDPDRHHEALWDLVDSPIAAALRPHTAQVVDAPQGPYAYCVDRALVSLRRAPPK